MYVLLLGQGALEKLQMEMKVLRESHSKSSTGIIIASVATRRVLYRIDEYLLNRPA
jgi:hypothetical protein